MSLKQEFEGGALMINPSETLFLHSERSGKTGELQITARVYRWTASKRLPSCFRIFATKASTSASVKA